MVFYVSVVYTLIGLCWGAYIFHDMTSPENVKEGLDTRPPTLSERTAMTLMWLLALFMGLLSALVWPASMGRRAFKKK